MKIVIQPGTFDELSDQDMAPLIAALNALGIEVSNRPGYTLIHRPSYAMVTITALERAGHEAMMEDQRHDPHSS